MKQPASLMLPDKRRQKKFRLPRIRPWKLRIAEIMEEKQQTEAQEDYEIQVENVTMTFRIIQNAPASVKEYMIQKLKKRQIQRFFCFEKC